MIFLQMSWTFNQVQTRSRRPPQLLSRRALSSLLLITWRRIVVLVSFAVVSEIYRDLIFIHLDDSSSDEETPDLRPKIQALMSAHFEEVRDQGFRDIRGRKSYSVNFVQNEEKRSPGMLTVVVFKLNFTKNHCLLFRKVCGERGSSPTQAETGGGCPRQSQQQEAEEGGGE